jgi:hypothetical protein
MVMIIPKIPSSYNKTNFVILIMAFIELVKIKNDEEFKF